MPRQNFLISYDCSDDKRRAKLFQLLEDHGDHAQYSVFFCELNPTELARLRSLITDIIHHRDDQVIILALGSEHALERDLEVLGSPYKPLTRTLVV